MTNKVFIIVLLFISYIFAKPAYCYNAESHKGISQKATVTSTGLYLPDIGLKTADDELTMHLTDDDRFITDKTYSVVDWVREGAEDEDDTFSKNFARYRNHFYDPIHQEGYSHLFVLTGEPVPVWALETKDFITQEYSFKDASDYLFKALTLTDQAERETYLAKTFYTLGHVLHLVQDMASVPHVRADSHGGYIIFGDVSLYESYTEKVFSIRFSGLDSPVYNMLPSKTELLNIGYPQVKFSQAYDFWTTDNDKGLADFTNYNFVSEDTNFDTNYYPNPVPKLNQNGEVVKSTVTIETLYEGINQPLPMVEFSELQPNGVQQTYSEVLGKHKGAKATVDFISTDIVDRYTGETRENQRASSLSIFNADLNKYNLCQESWPNSHELEICEKGKYTLNRFNFDAAHKFLIPRAVGYSAGLINYFFRGKLEMNLPEEGVYAIVDHAVTNKIDDGFTKVKMKVKNVTPAIDNVAQNMNGGEIILIARYHRNECYAADLSGESKSNQGRWDGRWNKCKSVWDPVIFGNQRPSWDEKEEMTVSDTQSINLDADAEETLTFNFSKPIPLNAIDLGFQLVYKGQLGNDETVVVSSKDISEPTFFSVMNMEDHFPIDRVMYPVDVILNTPSLFSLLERNGIKGYQPNFGDFDVRPRSYKEIKIQFGLHYTSSLPPVVTLATLEAGSYLRVAYLGNCEVNYAFFLSSNYRTAQSIKPQINEFQNPDNINFRAVSNFRNTYYWKILEIFSYYEELSSGGQTKDYSKVIPVTSDNLTPKPVEIHF